MKRKRTTLILLALAPILLGGWWAKNRLLGPLPAVATPYNGLSSEAIWPLPKAKSRVLTKGISQTSATLGDGTLVDFWEFDFKKNSRLRWEIYDQDENDAVPFDNHTDYWDKNVARATKELNQNGRGPVWVAWNGAFFGYNRKTNLEDSFHVSPVVLRGKAHWNTANHRWAFGVKNTAKGPVWKVFFKPNRAQLEKEFDYAAGALQCLILNGKPLKMEPFPAVGGAFKAQPVASTSADVGHIPYFDHMRTCRASIGWSRDNSKLYFLAVKEPDSEGASSVALSMSVRGLALPSGTTLGGGWTVADVQNFWKSKGVWGAVNSDAGDVLQWVARQPSGNYQMVPPRQESGKMRILCGKNWKGAIAGGGAQMYFLVREK